MRNGSQQNCSGYEEHPLRNRKPFSKPSKISNASRNVASRLLSRRTGWLKWAVLLLHALEFPVIDVEIYQN